MYFAGTAGSGVLLARLSDGTWSPPSAFTVRSGSVGIVYGVDVFDCVLVFNTKEAICQYLSSEMQLGGGVKLAAGPVGGNANTAEVKPVWNYTRSRGLYGGVTLDSTVISESTEGNAEFYGAAVSSRQILEGDVKEQNETQRWPAGAKGLMELLRGVDDSVKAAA